MPMAAREGEPEREEPYRRGVSGPQPGGSEEPQLAAGARSATQVNG